VGTVGTTAEDEDKDGVVAADGEASVARQQVDGLADRPQYEPPYRTVTVTYDDGSSGWRPKPRSFWASFTRTDARLFWLTFAATVAGALVSVMVVAVAVLLALGEPEFETEAYTAGWQQEEGS